MKIFLVVALCAFALTEVLSMPVSESGVQESLSVVPLDSSSAQHVLRRETPSPTTENQANGEVTKSIARFDDMLMETDEKKIEEPKKDDEKIIEEPKKEEAIVKSDNIQTIATTVSSEKTGETVQPKEAVRSVTIEESETIVPAVVPDSPVQEAVVPQVKIAQEVEAAVVKSDEKQQQQIEEKPVDTPVSAVKTVIANSEETPVVSASDVKSSPVVTETAEAPASIASAPVEPVSLSAAAAAAASESQSVEIPKISARSEIKEAEVPVASSPAVAEPEKPEEKKIIPTDRVTRGTEGPVEQVPSVSSSEPATVKAAPATVKAAPATIVSEIPATVSESEKPAETIKSKDAKEIETTTFEELKPELATTQLALAVVPEEKNISTIGLEKKDEEIIKSEEPIILSTEKSSSDIKVNADEKLEKEEIKIKSNEPEAPKEEIPVKNVEPEETKKELVRSVKDDSSEEKLDDKSHEEKDDKLIAKSEIKADDKSSVDSSEESLSSSAKIHEHKQEKKTDAKAEELPKPEEFKERK